MIKRREFVNIFYTILDFKYATHLPVRKFLCVINTINLREIIQFRRLNFIVIFLVDVKIYDVSNTIFYLFKTIITEYFTLYFINIIICFGGTTTLKFSPFALLQ